MKVGFVLGNKYSIGQSRKAGNYLFYLFIYLLRFLFFFIKKKKEKKKRIIYWLLFKRVNENHAFTPNRPGFFLRPFEIGELLF